MEKTALGGRLKELRQSTDIPNLTFQHSLALIRA